MFIQVCIFSKTMLAQNRPSYLIRQFSFLFFFFWGGGGGVINDILYLNVTTRAVIGQFSGPYFLEAVPQPVKHT